MFRGRVHVINLSRTLYVSRDPSVTHSLVSLYRHVRIQSYFACIAAAFRRYPVRTMIVFRPNLVRISFVLRRRGVSVSESSLGTGCLWYRVFVCNPGAPHAGSIGPGRSLRLRRWWLPSRRGDAAGSAPSRGASKRQLSTRA